MNSPPEVAGNDAQAKELQRLQEDSNEDLGRLRRLAKRRRTRVVCAKLLSNILFLFAWTFVSLNDRAYSTWNTLLGKGFWIDFSVYAGISGCLPLFSFIGLFRRGPVVTHLWFEIAWLLAISGFDGYLIWRQTIFWPPFKSYAQFYLDDPYLTISIVSYVLTVIALTIDIGLSLLWSGYLFKTAWQRFKEYSPIWVSEVQDFPWLDKGRLSDEFPGPVQLIFGASRGSSPFRSILGGLGRWLQGSTMFRQFDDVEPIAYSLIRGGLAVVAWVAIIIYAILNCVINPVRQFTFPGGLPTRFLLQDSLKPMTYGHVNGFITLDVVPVSQLPPDTEGWYYSEEMCNNIIGGIQATLRNPLSDEAINCKLNCGGISLGPNEIQELIQIEALWDCGTIWDDLKFRTPAPIPDSRPYVSVTWNSSAYSARPLLSAGLGNIHASAAQEDFRSITIDNDESNPHDWNGVIFNLTAGQNLRVDVGRRRYYTNRATFLDLIGIRQAPNVFVTYPILSVTPNSAAIDPLLTSLTFYPGFSAYDDEIYEEYLNHSVISGLSTTGGLYTAFDLVFIFLFGRSLLTALFGGKHITPFGAISSLIKRETFRKDLLKKYPGIDKQEANSTCKFLHDFVLDFKPLDIPPIDFKKKGSNNDPDQTSANPDDTGNPYIKAEPPTRSPSHDGKDSVDSPFNPIRYS